MHSNDKLKIVLLGSAHPLRGGLASYNERLAKALQDAGHSVTIYSFSLQYPSFLFPGKTQFSDGEPPENISIKSKVNSINPFNWLKIGYELCRMKPDILLLKYWLPFMGPCFGTIARITKWNKHTKVISILDNIIPHEKRTGDVSFTKYFVKPVDAFIAMSASVKEDLKKFSATKPCLLQPHPLFDNFGEKIPREDALRQLNLSPDFRYLLFFGFIRKYKGLDMVMKAMADEKIKSLPVKLIVAGEFYEDAKPYHDIIKELNLKERVLLFTDFIPNEKVKYYFSAADLVVQPYRHATQSGVTQIAYQFEKPMVVTNVGGLAEIVPDGKAGYVVEPDAAEIANAIHKFYESGNEQKLIEGVKEEKKKFGWDKMTEKIEELYRA